MLRLSFTWFRDERCASCRNGNTSSSLRPRCKQNAKKPLWDKKTQTAKKVSQNRFFLLDGLKNAWYIDSGFSFGHKARLFLGFVCHYAPPFFYLVSVVQ